MDRRLSLYRRGDYLMVADLFSGNGGILAVFLAIGRVSSNKFIQFPIWLFTYIFRGTPLYVQLLVFYSGMYTLEIVKGTELLNAFFPQRAKLHGTGVNPEYLRLYH